MTVTIAAKKNMTKISKQKQYWQQLADEYEKKIALLKQAKARAQTAKQKPIAASTTVRVFANCIQENMFSSLGDEDTLSSHPTAREFSPPPFRTPTQQRLTRQTVIRSTVNVVSRPC